MIYDVQINFNHRLIFIHRKILYKTHQHPNVSEPSISIDPMNLIWPSNSLALIIRTGRVAESGRLDCDVIELFTANNLYIQPFVRWIWKTRKNAVNKIYGTLFVVKSTQQSRIRCQIFKWNAFNVINYCCSPVYVWYQQISGHIAMTRAMCCAFQIA